MGTTAASPATTLTLTQRQGNPIDHVRSHHLGRARKVAEMMSFSQQAAKLIKDKFGVQVHTNMPIGGNPNRVSWVTSHADLAEFESAMTKILADADYQKLVAANAPNVIAGSTHDEVWRSV